MAAPAPTAAPTAYERRAANAAGFLARIHGVLWKWAPGASIGRIAAAQGPNLDRAESVVEHAGRRYRVTVEELEAGS
jgi:hypothetical protein